MKVIGRDIDDVDYHKYKQSLYIRAYKQKRLYDAKKKKYFLKKYKTWNFGKFRFRNKTRFSRYVRYKIRVTVRVTNLKDGKAGNYTGTSHPFDYYTRAMVTKETSNATSQALAYAIQDFFHTWIDDYEDMITYKLLNVRVLKLEYKRKR